MDERIRIGEAIEVIVVKVGTRGKVKLGIIAPDDVPVWRDELRISGMASAPSSEAAPA